MLTRSYAYTVEKDFGAGARRFTIIIRAADERAAEIQAAEIGQSLGIMLLGPV